MSTKIRIHSAPRPAHGGGACATLLPLPLVLLAWIDTLVI